MMGKEIEDQVKQYKELDAKYQAVLKELSDRKVS